MPRKGVGSVENGWTPAICGIGALYLLQIYLVLVSNSTVHNVVMTDRGRYQDLHWCVST